MTLLRNQAITPTIEEPVLSDAALEALASLEAMVLLAGTIRASELVAGIGRCVLDLPLKPGYTLLDHWVGHAERVARYVASKRLPVRVILDGISPYPRRPAASEHVPVLPERDPSAYRGTGGVLRDITMHYRDEAWILVSTAKSVLLEDMADLAGALADSRGDVAILRQPDHSPGGLMLVRCGVLRGLAEVGFVDFQEQALPVIAKNYSVRVVQKNLTGRSVRKLEGYLGVVKQYCWREAGHTQKLNPFMEDWQPTFRLIEDRAWVEDNAVIHDSVILGGAKVETGAVVVRSLVCPGARVRAGESVIDRVVYT